MNKFEKRCVSLLAGIAVIALGAIIIVVWIQFSHGAFRMPQRSLANITNTTYGEDEEMVRKFDKNITKGKVKK